MLDDVMTADTTADERGGSRRRRRRMGWGARILVSLLAVVLLLLTGVGGYTWYLSARATGSALAREDLIGVDDPLVVDGRTLDPTKTTDGRELVTGEGSNYLLLGSDARPGDTFSRADVIQLVHVAKGADRAWVIHLPRDLYVPIPGHGRDKINAAYAYGGAPLLVRTVQDLTGVKVDHVAKTDFQGFKDLTDAVGGVRVYAEEASTAGGNGGVDIARGWNDLDGTQALGFVRERYQLSQGDISRGQRQQAWIKGFLDKVLSPDVVLNPARLGSVIDAGTRNTVVDKDLTPGTIRSEALRLRGLRGDRIEFLTAPWAGLGTTAQGASIVELDEPGMARLSDALRTDAMGSYRS